MPRMWISTRLIGPVRIGYSQGLRQGRATGRPQMGWAEFIAKTLIMVPVMAFLLTGLWPLLIGYLALLLIARIVIRFHYRKETR